MENASDLVILSDLYRSPSEVTPILWVGNYFNGAELALANPHNFRSVLNVSTEEPYKKAQGIAYKEIPFLDGEDISSEAFEACMSFLMFQYETEQKTLIHCAAGISRSVCIAAAFLAVSGQMPFDAALDHVRKCRLLGHPHPRIVTCIRKHLKLWPYDGSLGQPSTR
jgi:protein-tyrosine phosphatase